MSEPRTNDIPAAPTPAYPALRKRLLALIEGHSRKVWTDYNIHDPGITLGEHLCFALTEAAYVCGLPIADLLAESDAPTAEFDARRVLPSGALTAMDWRKWILDRPGVRNAWVFETPQPARPRFFADRAAQAIVLTRPAGGNATSHPEVRARGFWDVEVEFDATVSAARQPIELAKLRTDLDALRNLGEVFRNVRVAGFEQIGICTELDVSPDADIEEVGAKVVLAIEDHISPLPRFKTMEAMLAEGASPEEIFDGPRLVHGFLDDAELARSDRRDALRASDLIQVLLDVPGVLAVRRLRMTAHRNNIAQPEQDWVLPLDRSLAPRFSLEKSCLGFWKRDLPFYPESAEFHARIAHLRARVAALRALPDSSFLPTPEARRRGLEPYQTVLNLLPLNYGVGPAGLPKSSAPERLAQAAQLKTFMAIMEHFLAGHREQVRRLPEMLGLRRYTSVLAARWPAELAGFATLNPAGIETAVEPASERRRRRQAIASHLLARFGRDFAPLAMLAGHRALTSDPDAVLAAKTRMLAALPELARDRAQAANLRKPHSVANVSGYERFIRNLLGVAPAVGHPVVLEKSADGWKFAIDSVEDNVAFDSAFFTTRADALAALAGMLREGRVLASYGELVVGDERKLQIKSGATVLATSRGTVGVKTRGLAAPSMPAKMLAEAVAAAQTQAIAFFSQMPADTSLVLENAAGDFIPAWQFSFGKLDGSIRLDAARSQPTQAAALAEAALAAVCAREVANYVGTEVRDHASEGIATLSSGTAQASAALLAGLAEDVPMFLIEHGLLIPEGGATATLPVCDRDLATGAVCYCDDPYSFRLTLVLPAERVNFTNLEFRRHFEQVLREELPAHLFLKICWLSEANLTAFAPAYLAWRMELAKQRNGQANLAAAKQDALVAVWRNMRSVFPVATLHDFLDGNDENPAVLDQTFLGTFQPPPP